MLKKLTVAALAAALLGYFASPYWAAYQMAQAFERNDDQGLAEHVDFPALRENLKDQLQSAAVDAMAGPAEGADPFAAFGATLGAFLAGSAVDALVTPAGLRRVMQGNIAPDTIAAAPPADAQNLSDAVSNYTWEYKSLNKFVVDVQNEEGAEIRYVFRRRGLLDWKLTGITLPQ